MLIYGTFIPNNQTIKSTMSELNIKSREINLQSIDDDTLFSDQDRVQVEEVNFEFTQNHKLRGIFREMSIFNSHQCYQSIQNKHQRKYKYRVDMTFLDPRPFREKYMAWKWLFAALALLALSLVLIYVGWIGNYYEPGTYSEVTTVAGIFTAIVCALIFTHRSHDKVVFRTEFGKVKLIELINNHPDKQGFTSFLSKFVKQIKRAKTDSNFDTAKLVACELQELRRLKEESVISENRYEIAKKRLFKHKAFNSTSPAESE
jgi:hypothetical protein